MADAHDECRIKSVYHWQNGMTMVFCEHARQMPCLQGPTQEVQLLIDLRMAAGRVVEHLELSTNAQWVPLS